MGSSFFLIGCWRLSGRSFVLRAGVASGGPKQTHQITKPSRNLKTGGERGVNDKTIYIFQEEMEDLSTNHLARSLVAEQSRDGLKRALIGSFLLTRRQNDPVCFSGKKEERGRSLKPGGDRKRRREEQREDRKRGGEKLVGRRRKMERGGRGGGRRAKGGEDRTQRRR